MLTVIIVGFVLLFAICNLDKLKYLGYIFQFIWGFIKSIPDLLRATYLLIKAGVFFSIYLALTWGFWPLALWIIFFTDVKSKH